MEITKLIKIDLKTGEIEMPDESRFVIGQCTVTIYSVQYSALLPKGKHWRDIRRYDTEAVAGSSG